MTQERWLEKIRDEYDTALPVHRAIYDSMTLGIPHWETAKKHGVKEKYVATAAYILRKKGVGIERLRGQISPRVTVVVGHKGRLVVDEQTKLKAIEMRQAGLTQAEIANTLHVSQISVSRWERAYNERQAMIRLTTPNA